jgi:hypothetical protein
MEFTSSSFVAKVQTFQMFLVARLAIKKKGGLPNSHTWKNCGSQVIDHKKNDGELFY